MVSHFDSNQLAVLPWISLVVLQRLNLAFGARALARLNAYLQGQTEAA